MLQQLTKKIASNPSQLFLIDGLGALLSIFLLGFVLVQLESFFGIPISTLYFLAFIPCFFVVYDFYCFSKIKNNIAFYLKGIAYMNSFYCLISIGLAAYHYQKLTYFGWAYIIGEIIIISTLINLELKIAAELQLKK